MAEDEEIENDIDQADEGNGEKVKKTKKRGCLLKLILLFGFIGLLIAILGFNAFNIRDKYLRSSLEKVPIIKNLLPELPVEETLEDKISPEEEMIASLNERIAELNSEVNRLKVFEGTQLQFKNDKEAFDQMIALNDPKAYASYYESILPENAEELYKQVVVADVKDAKLREYIKTFENMKKDSASAILEELILTDIELVITILENVNSEQRGDILSTMKAENAATCSRLLYPE